MNVVIRHVPIYLDPQTRALGESVHAGLVDVSASDTAYYDLMAALWAKGESFIIVEHDVVPTEAVLADMWNCSREWCAGAREDGGWFLGCMKFGAALLRRTPWALERVAEASRHWNALDLHLRAAMGAGPTEELRVAGWTGKPHLHYPAVRHPRTRA